MTTTQRDEIRRALLDGESLTPLDALSRFHCFRLGARIHELKREGMAIEVEMVKTSGGATVASYRLSPQEGQRELWGQ